jgi:hypothetical protein
VLPHYHQPYACPDGKRVHHSWTAPVATSAFGAPPAVLASVAHRARPRRLRLGVNFWPILGLARGQYFGVYIDGPIETYTTTPAALIVTLYAQEELKAFSNCTATCCSMTLVITSCCAMLSIHGISVGIASTATASPNPR